MPNGELKQLMKDVESMKDSMSDLKYTLLNPDDGVVVNTNKNTEFRHEMQGNSKEYQKKMLDVQELKSWRAAVNKALWIIFGILAGVIIRMLMMHKGIGQMKKQLIVEIIKEAVKEAIKKRLKKEGVSSKIECQNCSWSWEKKDGGKDPRTCHKCGHTNTLQALEGVHDPVKPGILKDRLGELSCTKVRKAKAGTKDKGSHFAKACQRYLNYHCQQLIFGIKNLFI